jgi:hypothetical protein
VPPAGKPVKMRATSGSGALGAWARAPKAQVEGRSAAAESWVNRRRVVLVFVS